jgi:hypothetical protein
MTFLPVVERELRVASRKHFTYWLRLVAAGFLLLVYGIILLFCSLSPITRGTGWSMGQIIFSALKWMAFLFAASWGVFLPSDALSEEKREGTLGLLFLTDLRGYDVVFGKFMSLGLQSFYGLLAGFPIMALAVLGGGVSGAEFWRTVLAICNTLFFSLAIGLLVSSISREVIKAINGVAVVSLFFLAGLPWLDLALAKWDSAKWKCIFSIASPGYLFSAASAMQPADYWECLVVQHLMAWIFLIATCLIVPRAWQEKGRSKTGFFATLADRWRFGGKAARLVFRKKMIGRNPILWLALRDHWLPRLIMALTLIAVLFLSWNIYANMGSQYPLKNVSSVVYLLMWGLTLWIAIQASRLCLESARSGAMELILVTPLPPEQFVRSQWGALLRTYCIPAVLLLGLLVWEGVDPILQMTKGKGAFSGNSEMVKIQLVQLSGSSMNFLFRLGALAWFGMWMGLTNRKITIAVLKTILFICVLPWVVGIFVQIGCVMTCAFATGGRSGIPMWLAFIPPMLLEFAKNIFFIAWSRRRLLTRFRQTVAETEQSSHVVRISAPSPIPAVVSKPLVS